MSTSLTTLEETVASGDAVGVVAIARDDHGTVFLDAAGYRNREASSEMSPDTLFYIASMTKAVTSVAAMQCVERGLLELDGPIEEILPFLAKPPVLLGYTESGEALIEHARRPITLRHLLTHTSGLGYTTWNAELFEYRQRFPDAMPIAGPDLRRSAPLVHQPGESWEYGTSTDFVGLAIESVTGLKLGDYFEQNIFAPLGMVDSSYDVPGSKRSRLAARYLRQSDGSLERESTVNVDIPAFHTGGGGLYSTAVDYGRFLAAMLTLGGSDNQDIELLRPDTIAEMARNQIGHLVAGQMPSSEPHRSYDAQFLSQQAPGWGLGFLINRDPVPGARAGGSLSWGGLYNCYYWIDPATRVVGAMFTQVLPFADPRILERFAAFERSIYAGR